jgi:4a-hydroxytetrahydrobiopterin dehydratase
VIFLAGFVLYCLWAFTSIANYYRQAVSFNDNPPPTTTGNGHFAIAGIVLCAIAWLWSLATSITLMREVSQLDAEALKSFAAVQVQMNESQIQAAVAALPQWRRDGQVISRTYEFTDFPEAMKFVNSVAAFAEQAQHHPDVDIRWNKVTLALTTHDAGGLTQKDFAMARQCDGLA